MLEGRIRSSGRLLKGFKIQLDLAGLMASVFRYSGTWRSVYSAYQFVCFVFHVDHQVMMPNWLSWT